MNRSFGRLAPFVTDRSRPLGRRLLMQATERSDHCWSDGAAKQIKVLQSCKAVPQRRSVRNGHPTGTTLDPEGPLSGSGDGTCNREWHDKKPIRRNTAHVKPPCRLGIQSGIVALGEQRKQYGRWLPMHGHAVVIGACGRLDGYLDPRAASDHSERLQWSDTALGDRQRSANSCPLLESAIGQ